MFKADPTLEGQDAERRDLPVPGDRRATASASRGLDAQHARSSRRSPPRCRTTTAPPRRPSRTCTDQLLHRLRPALGTDRLPARPRGRARPADRATPAAQAPSISGQGGLGLDGRASPSAAPAATAGAPGRAKYNTSGTSSSAADARPGRRAAAPAALPVLELRRVHPRRRRSSRCPVTEAALDTADQHLRQLQPDVRERARARS